MEDKIEIFADTHEPGSLETLLWFIGKESPSGTVYSTGDHIPSGMHSPDRKIVDQLKAEGKTNIQEELLKRYNENPEYRAAVDAHYQKTIANQATRKQALINWHGSLYKDGFHSNIEIISCAGNQDFAVGEKVKKHGGESILKYIGFGRTGDGFSWVLEPSVFIENYGEIGVILVPHDPKLAKDKRVYEEIREGLRLEQGITDELSRAKKIVLLSHQSPDCTLMGLPESARDAYTEPGNRALIAAYYELAASIVGAEKVQLVHGHHHTPYKQYEFRGSKVHNLNIGDLLLVDPKTGDSEIKHIVQY